MSIRSIAFSLTSASAGLLAIALLLAGLSLNAITLLLVFAIWVYLFLRKNSKSSALGFGMIGAFSILGGLASVQGLGKEINFYLLLAPILLSLAGYDLTKLDILLRNLGETEANQSPRIRQHYLRLGLTLLSGLLLATLGFNWKISLSFGWVATLAILGALGLGVMVRFLLNRQE